jgi:hypothetical protein
MPRSCAREQRSHFSISSRSYHDALALPSDASG